LTHPQKSLDQLVSQTSDLPSMPAAVLAVMRETASATSNARTVAMHLSQDQALAARVLRLANSAYYGLSRQVSDVNEAVVLLGMRAVRNLALVASSYPWMSKPIPGYGLGPREMWKHSFAVAVCGKIVANRTRAGDPETAFTAGLLHNLGKCVLGVWLEGHEEAIGNVALPGVPFFEVERIVTGFDHSQVGAHLADRWNLPESLVAAIQYHHEPDSAAVSQSIVDCVHLADSIVLSMGIGLGHDGLSYPLSSNALQRLGVGHEEFEGLIEACSEERIHFDDPFGESDEGASRAA